MFSLSKFLTKRLGLHPGATAYASTSLGTAFMHPVLTFYYVKIFLERYEISEQQFQIAQLVYMVWNSINDPLFGYLQDNCKSSLVRSRRHTIYYGAPLWALSFLIPWFPWADYEPGDWLCGLHLITSLCFYDAMFTYVLLANCGVFAELSVKHEDRLQCLQYSSVAGLLGSLSVFVCEHFSSHLENYHKFQLCCVILAILAWLSISYTGRHAVTLYDLESVEAKQSEQHSSHDPVASNRGSKESIWRLTWQILTNRNFFWFVIVNLLHEFHRNFAVNFVSIITDTLVPRQYMTKFVWELFYGSLLVIPRLTVIFSRTVIQRYGYYKISKISFILKIIMGVIMYVIGYSYSGLFLLFTVTMGLVTYFSSAIMMMPLSDVVDEDMKIYNRKHPMSSMVFGTNALITKPGISLAPMLVVYLLNVHGYEEYKADKLAAQDLPQLKDAMFALACFIPVVVGCLQTLLWTRYKIRNSHTTITTYIEN